MAEEFAIGVGIEVVKLAWEYYKEFKEVDTRLRKLRFGMDDGKGGRINFAIENVVARLRELAFSESIEQGASALQCDLLYK